ncbi:MAG: invasion associated locus B family protein [Rhodospirillaceae bacterium]
MWFHSRSIIVVLAALAGYAGLVFAQDVTALGRHGDWIAYTYEEIGQRVCYMTSAPTRSEGDYTRRGDVQMLVTHRPARNAYDVVSVVAGYEYQRDSDVTMAIDGSRFQMFTNGDRAWARDGKVDQDMTQRMIKGRSAVVTGTSSRGTLTTDTFSLIGFTAAHEAISRACDRTG